MSHLDQCIQKFLKAKKVKAEKTVEFYRVALNQFQLHVGTQWPPTVDLINDFLGAAKARGCKDGTVHAYYRGVRAWCYWLKTHNYITDNPIGGVTTPPNPRRKIPRCPKNEYLKGLFSYFEQAVEEAIRLNQTLEQWTIIRDLAIFSLMFDTGLRIGEVEYLVIEHVDLLTALIRICKHDGLILLSSPHPHWDWVMEYLEHMNLTQKRTSEHSNLTDFKSIPLPAVVLKRPMWIHQVALFRNSKQPIRQGFNQSVDYRHIGWTAPIPGSVLGPA